jgi:hypothetical protein
LCLLVYYDVGIIKNTPNINVNARDVAASMASVMPSAFDATLVLMFPVVTPAQGGRFTG